MDEVGDGETIHADRLRLMLCIIDYFRRESPPAISKHKANYKPKAHHQHQAESLRGFVIISSASALHPTLKHRYGGTRRTGQDMAERDFAGQGVERRARWDVAVKR